MSGTASFMALLFRPSGRHCAGWAKAPLRQAQERRAHRPAADVSSAGGHALLCPPYCKTASTPPAAAISDVQDFAVGGRGPKPAPVSTAFESMYDQSSDSLLHTTGDSTFEAIRML